MLLLERINYIDKINEVFDGLSETGGHTLCITGEAGIGKTSVVKYFVNQIQDKAYVYEGSCDFLFTPRPLGPLYDIALQLDAEILHLLESETDRSQIFTRVFRELSQPEIPVVLIFEDIHWADEATLDFIKFLARRIAKIHCLFILTFRDDEIFYGHPLRNVLGELPGETFSKLHLERLSKETVTVMARDYGISGEDVYRVSGGNPFFVKEILASYNIGIPENIRDLVLSVFFRQPQKVRELWELISVFPSGIELWLFETIEPDFFVHIEPSLSTGILICENNLIFFKHELYRAILEDALSPLKKMALHKEVLKYLLENKDKGIVLVSIVHHGKNAHDWKAVEEYAPKAALQAASFGSHLEASKLYATAIQYTTQKGRALAVLYENHAYECYLTNQIHEGVVSQEKALEIWEKENDILKIGASLRFISRLSWFEGKREKAEEIALKSIGVLQSDTPTRELATAYSNYAQLKMLSDDAEQCLLWGEKTLAIAELLELNDIKSHILNNIGCVQTFNPGSQQLGEDHLNKSLSIALQFGYQEHAARAYTNICTTAILVRDYPRAEAMLEEGLKYCYDHDLDSWTYYKLSWKARVLLERGKWDEASEMAQKLLNNPSHPGIVSISALVVLGILKMRKGEEQFALSLFNEAKGFALSMKELQRSVPLTCTLLEYGWIYNKPEIAKEMVDFTLALFKSSNNVWYYSELMYWLDLVGEQIPEDREIQGPYVYQIQKNWKKAAESWQDKGCPYHQALALLQGGEKEQKHALGILDELGATAVLEHFRQKLRSKGMKNIPRGARQSTKENPAQLTSRQIEVLYLLKEGLQNNEMADKLFISCKTVDHHLSSIFLKLHVNSRTKAVAEASRLGILK